MDKYEYKVRADEIKELIAQGDYAQAAEIADTIDWRRVKSVMMLCTISDLYKINRRYEDARDMLLLAYERRPGGRTICYSLCELSLKMEEFVQAVEYYKEFVQVAPKDPGRYILHYKLCEAQDVSLEERIEILEELKKHDYREKWAYELAYLYHRVGLATRCVEECDEMILWFGEGKYVIKAMELKMLHQPLTPQQQEKYDYRFGKTTTPTSIPEKEESTENVVVTAKAQQTKELIPEQIADAMGDTKIYKAITPEQLQELAQNTETVQEELQEQEVLIEAEEPKADEMDIHVKTVDVGQYNTMNLQAELAAGLKEVLGEDKGETIQNPITRSIMAPMMESDTESLDYPQIDEVSEEDLEPEPEQMESSEVFFGETEEINHDESMTELHAEEPVEEEIIPEDADAEEMAEEEAVTDETAEIVMEQMRLEGTGEIPEMILTAEPPKELAGVLSQESDGQISLVMPETESVEKQITGQMSIEDILAEWERMKRENEEKRKEEVRQHVLQQTGTMFTEFEASVRDGLLEQLESGKLDDADMPDSDEEIAEEIEEEITEEIDEAITEDAIEDIEEFEETPEEDAGVIEEVPEEIMEDAEEVAEEMIEEAVENFEEVGEVEEIEEIEEIEEELPEVSEEEFAEDSEEEYAEDSEEEFEEELTEEDPVAEPDTSAPAAEREAVVRDKAKIRSLTKEEKELYASFLQSKDAKEQLVKVLDNISLAAYTGNVIITGEEGMDTLTLAKNIVRELQMTDSNFSGKVAKISGSALNKRDVAAIVQELENGALIVQKAADINSKTAAVLNKALQQDTRGIVVVLEDTKRAMNHFLSEHVNLHECFNARMDVEALSDDALVAFGKKYARELEYSIDEMGVLALHTRIADMQTSDHSVTIVEVKQIIDEAIYHANKKTMGHFFDVLFARRYDDEDMIILGENDFT